MNSLIHYIYYWEIREHFMLISDLLCSLALASNSPLYYGNKFEYSNKYANAR